MTPVSDDTDLLQQHATSCYRTVDALPRHRHVDQRAEGIKRSKQSADCRKRIRSGGHHDGEHRSGVSAAPDDDGGDEEGPVPRAHRFDVYQR